jgi:hypothetical protein
MHPAIRWFGVALLLGLPLGLSARGADSTPSSRPANAVASAEEIRAMAKADQHREVVKAVSRVLALRGEEASRYDRHKMLLLKAESHLALNERQPALATLEMARKEADQRSDFSAEAEAMGYAKLIRESKEGVYTPRTGEDHTGITISDRKGRDRAMRALFEDEHAALKQALVEAKTELDLPALGELSDQFLAVQFLERATTGKSDQSEEAANKVARWVANLVDHSLDGFGKQIKRINGSTKGKRDLSAADARVLQNIRSTCDELPGTLERVNKAVARPVILGLQERAARAAKIRDRAKWLMERED